MTTSLLVTSVVTFCLITFGTTGLLGATTAAGATTTTQAAKTQIATTQTLRGVSISAAQHPGGAAIDWTKVAAAGYTFAAIEASQGTS